MRATPLASDWSGAYAIFFVPNGADRFIPDAALETDSTVGYKDPAGPVELDTGSELIVDPVSSYANTSTSPHHGPSAPTWVELLLGATLSGFNDRLGYIPTKFFGWNKNNSGVGGIFNGKQPSAGLTGASHGAINVEAFCTYPLGDCFYLQALADREKIPRSRELNWNCGQVKLDAKLAKAWSLGLTWWITSNPEAFRDYGSLTENGQLRTPSRNTAVRSLSRQL
ncbi:MAG: hypothetical protein RJA98_2942 [Pseudomonadota bacterium]